MNKTIKIYILTILMVLTHNSVYAATVQIPAKQLGRFANIYDLIKKYYVEETDDEVLFENAIIGMVKELDPHSSYLKPKEQKKLTEQTKGEFGGLGIVITTNKKGNITIVSPIDDTPAWQAGLITNDEIIKIGKIFVNKITLDESIKLMRGKPGTAVSITILRDNKKEIDFTIVRDIIKIKSVVGYVLEDDISYIRISNFQENTYNSLVKEIKKIKDKNNIILDLRSNPGGLLDSAIDISDLFLPKNKLIVSIKGKRKENNINYFSRKNNTLLKNKKIIVLINNGSASASEIVAGALQDHKKAIIIGQTSFGKGSVQTAIPLNEGYGIKITTARYYTPNNRSIQATGIKPDIELYNIDLHNIATQTITTRKEVNLKGHLKNDTEEKNNDDSKKIEKEMTPKEKNIQITIKKLKQDYYIHEAIKIFKSLKILAND